VAPGALGIKPDKRSAAEVVHGHERLAALLHATRGECFEPLPAARREVQGIAETFRSRQPGVEPTVLIGSAANEPRLDEMAVNRQLSQYRFIHLATHGVADNERALRSFLLLAQDRLPDPVEQALAGKPVYDGRLTAEQILHTWVLDADLVTLSTCESGRGRLHNGEGYLGFAQALLLAGARSVVLSLWKVDDTATALLMQRFYQNLLGGRADLKAPMPKAEALREAKGWLRGLTTADVAALSPRERGTVRPRQDAVAGPREHPFDHPHYWSAFILIGDPD